MLNSSREFMKITVLYAAQKLKLDFFYLFFGVFFNSSLEADIFLLVKTRIDVVQCRKLSGLLSSPVRSICQLCCS